jgi:3D (Asp-Asp-Asp) domain-containing protein
MRRVFLSLVIVLALAAQLALPAYTVARHARIRHYLAGPSGWTRTTQYTQCCVTASGARVFYGEVAADPSVPFGAHVHIPGLGVFVVLDRGGAVWGAHLDIYVPSYPRAGIRDWYRGVWWG